MVSSNKKEIFIYLLFISLVFPSDNFLRGYENYLSDFCEIFSYICITFGRIKYLVMNSVLHFHAFEDHQTRMFIAIFNLAMNIYEEKFTDKNVVFGAFINFNYLGSVLSNRKIVFFDVFFIPLILLPNRV